MINLKLETLKGLDIFEAEQNVMIEGHIPCSIDAETQGELKFECKKNTVFLWHKDGKVIHAIAGELSITPPTRGGACS
jgi:hypothetical protein